MNIFQKIFKHITSKPIQVFTKEEPVKYLNDIAQFDDVWIGINGKIYEGWVVERKENNIEIPANVAGLMLSGIISDTLLFRSPTTTEYDKIAVKALAEIANVDYEQYGMEMLKAGASLKGKTKDEILYMDFKNFTIDGYKVGIGQVITLNIDEIESEKDEYIELINSSAKNNDYHIMALFATDIIKNGSYVYFNDSAKEIIQDSFGVDEITQGYYLDRIVSRKKQIIPNIISSIEKK